MGYSIFLLLVIGLVLVSGCGSPDTPLPAEPSQTPSSTAPAAPTFADSLGPNMLVEIIATADSRDIEIRIALVKAKVLDVLRRDGVVDRLGESRIYSDVYEAAADKIPNVPVSPAGSD